MNPAMGCSLCVVEGEGEGELFLCHLRPRALLIMGERWWRCDSAEYRDVMIRSRRPSPVVRSRSPLLTSFQFFLFILLPHPSSTAPPPLLDHGTLVKSLHEIHSPVQTKNSAPAPSKIVFSLTATKTIANPLLSAKKDISAHTQDRTRIEGDRLLSENDNTRSFAAHQRFIHSFLRS